MRFKEHILSTACKIAAANKAGNYDFQEIDYSKIMSEDEVIEATAKIISTLDKEPIITQLPKEYNDGLFKYRIKII